MAAEPLNCKVSEESPGSFRARAPLERAVGVTQRKVPQRKDRRAL